MQNLIEFLEKETNKKINIFEYKNEKIHSNQNLIQFNGITYVIEFIKDNVINSVNGYCYLFYQQNLDFDSLKKILNNLFEDVQIYKYNNYLLLMLLVYSLVPAFPFYSMSAVKDVIFTSLIILYITKLYEFIKTDEITISNIIKTFIFNLYKLAKKSLNNLTASILGIPLS